MVVQEVFGVGWAGRRKLWDGFCGQTGRLMADAHSPACPAGSGTGSDLVYLWTGGLNREDGCGEPKLAGRRTKTQCVERSSFDLRSGMTLPAGQLAQFQNQPCWVERVKHI